MATSDSSTSEKRRSSWNWRNVFGPRGLAGVVLLFFLAMFFHLIGRHCVNGALERIYTPPPLTHDRMVLFREFIRIVEAHPEYTRVSLDGWCRLSTAPVIASDRGFSNAEVDALHRLSTNLRRAGCAFALMQDSYFLFMPAPAYVLPTWIGVVYVADGRSPNEIDDWILNLYKPFSPVRNAWYTSRFLVSPPR